MAAFQRAIGGVEMQRGQLAMLPGAEGRRAERRVVNLAASLREPGATVVDIEVLNLSAEGFAAASEMPLEAGAYVWLKLPGLEAQKSRVVWVEGEKAGFQFNNPLHPAELGQFVEGERKALPRGHFGPRRLQK
jgi:hypothetical protein